MNYSKLNPPSLCLLALLGIAMTVPKLGQATDLSLEQALTLAENTSPSLKAAISRESGAKELSTIAKSGYYPTLDLAAVDGTGFPGSSAGLDGFSGIVSSPFREGPAADAFTKWDLLDASVWHTVAAANFEFDASREAVRIQRAQVDENALRIYLEAVLYRGQSEAWQKLVNHLDDVQKTVSRYIRNGQYSEVQGFLINDQLDDATINQQDSWRNYQTVLVRLGILTGLDASTITCPGPQDIAENALQTVSGDDSGSPGVEQASDEAKVAGEETKSLFSQNFPKIEAGASLGYLNDSRLVSEQDYSAFIGVTLPLFEGFKINSLEKQASLEESARKSEILQAQLALDDLNARFDDQIEQGRSDMATLLNEQARAAKAVDLAKSRYLTFLGPLSDLQQALKDMVNIDNQIAVVKARLLLASGSKAFVNGAALSPEK